MDSHRTHFSVFLVQKWDNSSSPAQVHSRFDYFSKRNSCDTPLVFPVHISVFSNKISPFAFFEKKERPSCLFKRRTNVLWCYDIWQAIPEALSCKWNSLSFSAWTFCSGSMISVNHQLRNSLSRIHTQCIILIFIHSCRSNPFLSALTLLTFRYAFQ